MWKPDRNTVPAATAMWGVTEVLRFSPDEWVSAEQERIVRQELNALRKDNRGPGIG